MRLKRATRAVMVVAAVAALAACGLDLLATGDRSPEQPAGPDGAADGPGGDGSSSGDGPGQEGSQIELPPVPDPFLDAGLDANQDNCLAACDGGTCDAGWCVLDHKVTGTATNQTVKCPAGIPCEVNCGVGSCTQGIDCTEATACRLDCFGAGACTNQPVQCSGLACKIDCTGAGACTKGVDCDAGACTIGCLGTGSCTNATTTCNANTCTVRCGIVGDNGKGACSQGVSCDTTQLCDVGCPAHDACRNQPVSVRSDGTSIVGCTGTTTCNKGSVLSGAEAGILCSGAGSCTGKTFCDAGKCAARCDGVNFTSCCKPGSVCTQSAKDCSLNATGCP